MSEQVCDHCGNQMIFRVGKTPEIEMVDGTTIIVHYVSFWICDNRKCRYNTSISRYRPQEHVINVIPEEE